MFGLFTSKILTDEQIQVFVKYHKWIMENNLLINTNLVMTTEDEFRKYLAPYHEDGDYINGYFDYVLAHYGLQDDEFRIEPHSSSRSLDNAVMVTEGKNNEPGGTFSHDDDGIPLITYDPSMDGRPIDIVATLSHEICHYIKYKKSAYYPSGNIEDEIITDLMSIYNGFGIFALRSCFREENWTSGQWAGWSIKNSGYLSINETAFAVAMYANNDSKLIESIENHLDDLHYRKFIKAVKLFKRNSI